VELLRFQNVQKAYGHLPVLLDVSFQVMAGQKLGLIGPNGSGKTSILRLLTGEDTADRGAVVRVAGLRVGYVPQQVEYDAGQTVIETVLAEHTAAEAALREAEQQLADAPADGAGKAADAYERAREAFERLGGDKQRARAAGMLDSLGLAGRAESSVGELSGGERNVMSLVRALIAEPGLLVLDEPDNHLDFEGVAWLEDFLRGFRGAVLIVSHNRYLLDRVVGGILHLEAGKVREYTGNYSAYRAWVLREKLNQQADYAVNQKRLEQLEEMVKRFEEYARRTGDSAWGKRLRARRSQLEREKANAVEKPVAEQRSINFRPGGRKSQADIALQVNGYSKSFGELVLFDGAEMEVSSGERAALLGPNGSGKTTLLRDIIAEAAWDDEVLRIGPSMRVGYCGQQQDALNDRRTVMEELTHEVGVSPERAQTLLGLFLFRFEDWDKRVASLSGGERNRLQLCKVLTQQPNFLILDEPTNHLDIPAREAVEDVLTDFKGTILLVSHDRYLLDKIATRVIEVRDRKLVSYPGNFTEFWASRPRKTPAKARVTTRGRTRERAPAAASSARTRGERPSAARAPSALALAIEEAEQEKVALEKRLAAAFTDADYREGAKLSKQLEQHEVRLRGMYDRWVEEEG
jgi:ATP-binding cassette subfamily F protein 3